jgi:UPF0755 protein
MRTRAVRFAKLCVIGGAVLLAGCDSPHGAAVRVIIPRGASFRAAADSMAGAGVIQSPFAFRVYARARGRDRQIQAGTYLLRPGTRWSDLLRAMNGGTGIINRVTIPEGFTIAQITPVLVRSLHTTADSVDVAVRDSGLRARLADPALTLEGYLFPDTYVFAPGTSARQAVTEMVKRFEREWKPEYDTQAASLGRNRHDIVTMASIVEKEARVPEERPVIAAVYYNRLKDGMPLQADPTVQYALGKHTERVLYRDLTIDSPYNTYQHPGLPPGPIASPGGASLRAALSPAKVPYLYFVAASDGHHEFRATMAEHERARRALQAERDTDSAPKARNSAKPQGSRNATRARDSRKSH